MLSMFRHTASEPGMWRGWLKNGQSVEISWGRRGWEFGCGVHIHGCEGIVGSRMLFLRFWRLTVVIPLGVVDHPWPAMDAPQWSVYADREEGITLRWGHRYKSFDWPWSFNWHRTSYLMADGSWLHETQQARLGGDQFAHWQEMRAKRDAGQWSETHPYTYTLRSGETQHVMAKIAVEEAEWRRRWLPFTRIFAKIERAIDVRFDDEVGERAGSWKGGTIGCGYTMLPGEEPVDTLRRMEQEREFR